MLRFLRAMPLSAALATAAACGTGAASTTGGWEGAGRAAVDSADASVPDGAWPTGTSDPTPTTPPPPGGVPEAGAVDSSGPPAPACSGRLGASGDSKLALTVGADSREVL